MLRRSSEILSIISPSRRPCPFWPREFWLKCQPSGKRNRLGMAGSLLTREAGEVPVVLSVKDVVSTHLAILASTGSGKSYTAGVLIEELLRPYNRAAVLVVDPHGEYHTMASVQGDEQFAGTDGYRPEVKIFTPDRIKVRFSSLTEADIKYLLPEGTSEKMLHFLRQAFRSLQDMLKAEGRRDISMAIRPSRTRR